MTRPLTLRACPLDIPPAPREVTRASCVPLNVGSNVHDHYSGGKMRAAVDRMIADPFIAHFSGEKFSGGDA